MQIYNTLTKDIETVTSVTNDQHLGFYACGPTVYDYAHLGHVRKYTMDDILRRVLKRAGFQVKHVMNITDVGHLVSDEDHGADKIEQAARRNKKSAQEIARFYEDDFMQMMNQMNLLLPDVTPRATEHIQQQIDLVKALEVKGFTYEIPGDGIYFDVSRDPNYGQLAGLDLKQQQVGTRIGQVEGKRHPADFALWKFSPADEQRQMEWDSPWGKGFPGWHIECSAMSMEYLGQQFDLHSGGIDHIPIHHTNEIAQAENATGCRPFVRYWIHHNFLLIDSQKMSKSLGNFYRLTDIEVRGFSSMALKLLFLSAHYRDELNFTWDSLAAADKGYQRLQRRINNLIEQSEYASWDDIPELSNQDVDQIEQFEPEIKKIQRQFVDKLEDDLKTPQAVALMWKLLKRQEVGSLPVLKQMLGYFGLVI